MKGTTAMSSYSYFSRRAFQTKRFLSCNTFCKGLGRFPCRAFSSSASLTAKSLACKRFFFRSSFATWAGYRKIKSKACLVTVSRWSAESNWMPNSLSHVKKLFWCMVNSKLWKGCQRCPLHFVTFLLGPTPLRQWIVWSRLGIALLSFVLVSWCVVCFLGSPLCPPGQLCGSDCVCRPECSIIRLKNNSIYLKSDESFVHIGGRVSISWLQQIL